MSRSTTFLTYEQNAAAAAAAVPMPRGDVSFVQSEMCLIALPSFGVVTVSLRSALFVVTSCDTSHSPLNADLPVRSGARSAAFRAVLREFPGMCLVSELDRCGRHDRLESESLKDVRPIRCEVMCPSLDNSTFALFSGTFQGRVLFPFLDFPFHRRQPRSFFTVSHSPHQQ
jgi:hypothetical protein